jgi:hypothetical protein
MASLQERNSSFRVLFSYRGKLHTFTLAKVPQAEAKAGQVDSLLMRLKHNLVTVPDGVDVVSFVEHDGNSPTAAASAQPVPRKAATIGTLHDRYLETHGNGKTRPSRAHSRTVNGALPTKAHRLADETDVLVALLRSPPGGGAVREGMS